MFLKFFSDDYLHTLQQIPKTGNLSDELVGNGHCKQTITTSENFVSVSGIVKKKIGWNSLTEL